MLRILMKPRPKQIRYLWISRKLKMHKRTLLLSLPLEKILMQKLPMQNGNTEKVSIKGES